MGLNTMVQEKVFSDKKEEEKQINNIQLCLEWFKYNNLLKYMIKIKSVICFMFLFYKYSNYSLLYEDNRNNHTDL